MNSNSGSLFGGGGFGGTTNTQPSSLFGSTNAPSAFGASSARTTQPAQAPSLFGQSQGQPQAQPQAQPAAQPKSNAEQDGLSAQSTKPAFFNSLLERGKKRPLSSTGHSGNFDDVPSLQLGLDDIRRKARELGPGSSKDSSQSGTATKA